MGTEGVFDVIVIGGGQSALALGYYLRRTSLSFVLLDEQSAPGGAWRRTWPSLRLFSPGQWSSLPGYLMPRGTDEYPTRDEVIAYLAEYERRYAIPVERPVHVDAVVRGSGNDFRVIAGTREWAARAVVMATGNWSNPHISPVPGSDEFEGIQIHSAYYDGPSQFRNKRVVVVGAGNSGAQIAAELHSVANEVIWATDKEPVFLPDEIDGRYLFEQATARYKAIQEGRTPDPPRSLGDIVAVSTVRAARENGGLQSQGMFTRIVPEGVVWPNETPTPVDAIIWATGFRPALQPLQSLGVIEANGRVETKGTHSVREPRLWLVGYGEWTGFASATLIGVGRSARATVDEITAAL